MTAVKRAKSSVPEQEQPEIVDQPENSDKIETLAKLLRIRGD